MKFNFDKPKVANEQRSEVFNEINKELANLDIAAPFNAFSKELKTQWALLGLSKAYEKSFKHPQQQAEELLMSINSSDIFVHFEKLQHRISALQDFNEKNVLSGSYDAKLIDFISRLSDLFEKYGNLRDDKEGVAQLSHNFSQLHCFDTENEVQISERMKVLQGN